ncbi:MAG: histidine phosphatase family protein [Hyphomicrobiales bacterium]|nr:histidine phosphatase family protein [Hyphomicrobiales bacterium]
MSQTIYFVRHGQTDWNAEQRFQGQQDIPINALGREQATRNGAALRSLLAEPENFDFVSSPLSRTHQTMEIVRDGLGLPIAEYRTDDRLLELNYGDWEGQTLDEMRRNNGEMSDARNRDKWNFVPPGASAESYAMQAKRFAPWLDEVHRPTVCVTHGGILRCVWKGVGGISAEEAGQLLIPQDRILRLENALLDWL